MSRGLGKVQSAVLYILQHERRSGHEWTSAWSVIRQAKYGIDYSDPRLEREPPTNAEQQSVWRAIRGLERKGAIIARVVPSCPHRSNYVDWESLPAHVKSNTHDYKYIRNWHRITNWYNPNTGKRVKLYFLKRFPWRGIYNERGGSTHVKEIKLNVEAVEKLLRPKHLDAHQGASS